MTSFRSSIVPESLKIFRIGASIIPLLFIHQTRFIRAFLSKVVSEHLSSCFRSGSSALDLVSLFFVVSALRPESSIPASASPYWCDVMCILSPSQD